VVLGRCESGYFCNRNQHYVCYAVSGTGAREPTYREHCPFDQQSMVDKERMRSGHWFRLVLCVPFSVSTLMVG